MKNKLKSLALYIFFALLPINAQAESIFETPLDTKQTSNKEPTSNKEKISNNEQISKKEQIDNNQTISKTEQTSNKESLLYLLDNSDTKFPVTDYLYQGGFKKPNNQEIVLKEEEATPQTQTQTQTQDNIQEQEQKRAETLAKIEEQKQKLKLKEQELLAQIQAQQEQATKIQMEALIRESILANRNGAIASLQSDSKYGVDAFSNQKSIDISTNEHKLYRTIRAGRLIPAILTSAISSELQGIVTAQIEEDIYATMGRAVLIPRGSKAIGFYSSNTKVGQNRLEIKWREIITPQGINILLTGAIASDNMGMSGAVGSVNNRYWERYGIGYSLSTISNVLLLAIASKIDNSGNAYAQEIYSSSRNDISTIVDDIIQQQSQIKPVIEIKSGSRIFIVPTNHMWFAKPKNKEILTQYFE